MLIDPDSNMEPSDWLLDSTGYLAKAMLVAESDARLALTLALVAHTAASAASAWASDAWDDDSPARQAEAREVDEVASRAQSTSSRKIRELADAVAVKDRPNLQNLCEAVMVFAEDLEIPNYIVRDSISYHLSTRWKLPGGKRLPDPEI